MERRWDIWKLDAFRRAYDLSLEVHRVSHRFPKSEQYGGIADQLRRASKAVCALIAEGAGRQKGSDSEFRRYLIMAIGSLEESKLWCRYARDLDNVDDATCAAWLDEFSQIARMLQTLANRLSRPSAN